MRLGAASETVDTIGGRLREGPASLHQSEMSSDVWGVSVTNHEKIERLAARIGDTQIGYIRKW